MNSLICQKRYAIVVHDDRGPCFQVRFGQWANLLNTGAGGECEIITSTSPIFDETLLAHTASVTFQRFIGNHAMDIRRLASLKKKLGFDILLDYDDVLWDIQGKSPIPSYNIYPGDTSIAHREIERILPYVDRVTVSTAYLAGVFRHEFPSAAGRIHVVPNFAFTSLYWDEARPRRKRPLVAYTGSTSHFNPDDPGDLSGPWIPAIKEAVKAKMIDFHCFGPDLGPFEGINATLHKHQYASLWPQYLSRLAPDVIIAPLKDNLFNRCKSPIKALEAALVGSAFIGSISPHSPYSDFLTPATGIMEDDPPEQVLKAFELLKDQSVRNDNSNFVAQKVFDYGLMAEAPPAMDCFLGALFGRFLHKADK